MAALGSLEEDGGELPQDCIEPPYGIKRGHIELISGGKVYHGLQAMTGMCSFLILDVGNLRCSTGYQDVGLLCSRRDLVSHCEIEAAVLDGPLT